MGRHLRNDNVYAVGHWISHDNLCGYGKRIADGVTTEGQWDKVCYFKGQTSDKKDIKHYNPNVDLRAKNIDFDKYEVKPLDFDAM